ncbi:hypothetical protein SCUCBS95973_008202 [Sporothrix curviconia]|uniref:VLRF1 domain-containing protein n=1 Tax=Sporothrix curviconia TaxID=1260050 RepID=A0ABP0CKY8_9PEZI
MAGTDDILRRPLYLYGLPADVLATLAPVSKENATGSILSSSETPAADADAEIDLPSGPSLASSEACALCCLSFDSHADKRDHFKSDLHLFNLKQKLSGKAPVSEDDFERLASTVDESLSGSEWSESDSLSDVDEKDEDNDGDASEAASAATTSTADLLPAMLKKQAVLAEKMKKKKKAGRIAKNAGNGDDDENSDSDSDGNGDGSDNTNTVNRPKNHKQRQREAAANASLQPLLWFSSPLLPANTYFGAYRAMFAPGELLPADDDSSAAEKEDDAARAARILAAIHSRQLAPQSAPANNAANAAATAAAVAPARASRHIFMCMIGGGHFAAMVIALAPRKGRAGTVPMNREATVLAHKTFHRYTTRRKQGGSQSANDNAKGTAHSAGSSLRRYNEQALVDDIRNLLRDWKSLLDTAELLFVRASNTANQRTIFGPYDGQVLHRDDPRLRSFPFNTRRPTQKEIMRCFIELTRLKVREIAPTPAAPTEQGTAQPSSPATLTGEDATAATQQRQQRQQERRAAAKRAEEEEMALLHTSQLQALVRRSKVPALLAYLVSNDLTARTFRFFPPDAPQHHHAPTLLHYAASQNSPTLVNALLLRADADPTTTNSDGKTPFELAGDRPTRDAFRVARSELSAQASKDIDWDAARVPAPMTRNEAEQRDAREKAEAARKETERRRAEEARLREEAKKAESSNSRSASQRRLVGVLKSAQEIRQEEARGLTPEQKQRLERERRARAAEARLRQMSGN